MERRQTFFSCEKKAGLGNIFTCTKTRRVRNIALTRCPGWN
jgi:hypothetical protein